MTRADFLKALAVAAVAPTALAGKARKPRMAFQVYGVRDLCARDLTGTLRAARNLGYEGVETGRFYGRSAAEWKALCADEGLEIVALQLYPYNLTEPELSRTISFCHEIGCRRISTAWFKGSAENPGDWQLVVNVLNHAAEVCAREGIDVAYHNHDQEFWIRFDGQCVWEWLFEGAGRSPELNQIFPVGRFSDRVKQEFDPNWCAVAGEDPLQWLRRAGARSPTLHVTIDSPKCDWHALLAQAEKSAVEWVVAKPTANPDSLAGLSGHAREISKIQTGETEEK